MKKHVLLLVALISTAFCQAQVRSYYSPEELDRCHRVFDIDTTSSEILVEARAALTSNRERYGKSRDYWCVAWNYKSMDDYDYVRLQARNTDFGHLTDQRVIDVEYGRVRGGSDSVVSAVAVKNGVDPYNGYNTLAVEWSGGLLSVFVGSKRIEKVLEVEVPLPVSPQCRIISVGDLKVQSLVVECPENRAAMLICPFTEEEVLSRLGSSVDTVEGEWMYLDRDTDDSRARLGGRYTFYIIRHEDGYLLLYKSGAEVNAPQWSPLMIKGRMKPTRFVGHYDLVWYDSLMEPMDDDTYASIDEAGILTVEFPVYRSRMRFYRK